MSADFYIIEDDKVVQNILKRIIVKNNLGDIVGISDDGMQAIDEIKRLNPDIVLIDLLLPRIDGIKIVSAIREAGCKVNFIMISQVTSKEMIAKAYKEGIEFFINKPINVIEVIAVIEKVKEKIRMAQVIQSFENAIKGIQSFNEYTSNKGKEKSGDKDKVEKVLARLGILGEAGTNDIVEIILWLLEQDGDTEKSLRKYRLSNLFKDLNDRYNKEYAISSNVAAIEQRVRRAITKALKNIANLGIEDYGNEMFIKYSSSLFDFREVRKQMDFARGKSSVRGKISVKKFIEGIIVNIKNDI
ncbi:response regulator [Wukongibacter baidiensis]|uniref:response regulator n=1 Tax=Wukongibacter baidiensis TaxID=1723361 RepID=UPI003D7F255C